MGDVGDVQLGRQRSPKNRSANFPTKYLRAANITEAGLNLSDVLEMEFTPAERERFQLRDGDILLSEASGSSSQVGKPAVWRGDFPLCCFQNTVIRFRSGELDSQYLLWVFTHFWRNGIFAAAAGGVGINHLSATKFSKLLLPIAPIDQRGRIVAEIEKQSTRMDAGVAALRRVQSNLKRYRAAVLDAACEGRLVPTEAEIAKRDARIYETGEQLLQRILVERRQDWKGRSKDLEPPAPDAAALPSLPEGWTWTTLGALADSAANSITDGPFGSNLKTEHYTSVGPRVVRLQNVGDGAFVDGDAHIPAAHFGRLQKHRVFAGDLIIAALGETLPRTCIVPDSLGPAIVKADCVRFRAQKDILPAFLNVALNAPAARKRTEAIVHGVGRPRLNLGEIKALVVPLPPSSEQIRIVAEVERRLSVIDGLARTTRANVQRAIALRKSMLQRAFSGELVKAETRQAAVGGASTSPVSTQRRHFARAVLSGEIVHRLHNEPTFGRVKHQKIFHLCEHVARLREIQGQYHREAAGPLDNKLIYANTAELRKQKWYEQVDRSGIGHEYKPLAKAGGHRKYAERLWTDQLPAVERLIEMMRTWKTERCEIFSTVYAAWNDLVLWGREVTDDAIVYEILHRWHESKKRIPEDKWRAAIGWMRREGFVPTGFGRPTSTPAPDDVQL